MACDGSAVVHQLAEQRAKQEQGKELRHKLCRASHEGLRPVRKQRLAGRGRCNERRSWSEQKHAPAFVGQPDQSS